MADGYDQIDYENDLRRQREANPVPPHTRYWCRRPKSCPWHLEVYSMTGQLSTPYQPRIQGTSTGHIESDSANVEELHARNCPMWVDNYDPDTDYCTCSSIKEWQRVSVDLAATEAGLTYWQLGTRTHEIMEEINGRSNMHRREVIEREMRRLQAELAKLSRFPEDNFADGTVLKFEKSFSISWEPHDALPEHRQASHRIYSYAAIKVGMLWYTTGPKSPKSYTWDELIEWMGDGVKEVWLMESNEDILSQQYHDAWQSIEDMKNNKKPLAGAAHLDYAEDRAQAARELPEDSSYSD